MKTRVGVRIIIEDGKREEFFQCVDCKKLHPMSDIQITQFVHCNTDELTIEARCSICESVFI